MPSNSPITIENPQVAISFQPGDDKYSVAFQGTSWMIDGLLETSQQSARIIDADVKAASWQAIKLDLLDDNADIIMLHPDAPYACVKRVFANPTNLPRNVKDAVTARFRVTFDKPVAELRLLSCEGLMPASTERQCYMFLAIVDPSTRHGILAGWLTQEIGSGIAISQNPQESSIELAGRSEFGNLLIGSGDARQGDIFILGYLDDCITGLEDYGRSIAQYYNIELPKFQGGYCTWYSTRIYGAGNERGTEKLAKFCNQQLKDFGFDTIQIDDKWQAGPRRNIKNMGPHGDFSMHNPRGPYHHGMKSIASKITAYGLRAGLWLMPFAWDPESNAMKAHHDWYAKKHDGSIYDVRWAGWCLDMTNPQARKHVATTIDRMTREWGFKYLKMDAMWTGLLTKLVYAPQPVYTPEGFGDAVLHDPAMTNVQAFRAGLTAINEAAAPGTFLQGCTIAQNMRTLGPAMGLLHAMRIGRDIGAKWAPIVDDAKMGGRLFFLNTRVWYNDPDCLMLRKPLTLNQARAWGSWIAISGQLNIVSEWLPDLPEDRLDVVKRTMPMTGLCGKPLDLLEHDPARIWHMADMRGGIHARRDVLALFNWDTSEDVVFTVDISRLGLQENTLEGFAGFSFWDDKFIDISIDNFSARVAPTSCMVIALQPLASQPRVISTSRHVTQGIVDVTNETWQEDVLSGTSDIVGNDTYELRVDVPPEFTIKAATAISRLNGESLKVSWQQPDRHARITIQASKTCTIDWHVEFAGGG